MFIQWGGKLLLAAGGVGTLGVGGSLAVCDRGHRRRPGRARGVRRARAVCRQRLPRGVSRYGRSDERVRHADAQSARLGCAVWTGDSPLAATISTTSNAHMGITATLVRDLYQRFLHPQATSDQVLRMSRILTVVTGGRHLGAEFLPWRSVFSARHQLCPVGTGGAGLFARPSLVGSDCHGRVLGNPAQHDYDGDP